MAMVKLNNNSLINLLIATNEVKFNPVLAPGGVLVIKNNQFYSVLSAVNSVEKEDPHYNDIISKITSAANANQVFTAVELNREEQVRVALHCLPFLLSCSENTFMELYESGIISDVRWVDKRGAVDFEFFNINDLNAETKYLLREPIELFLSMVATKFTVMVEHSKANVPGVGLLTTTRSIDVPSSYFKENLLKSGLQGVGFTFTQFVNTVSQSLSEKYDIPLDHVKELLYGWNKTPSNDQLFNRVNEVPEMDNWLTSYSVLLKGSDADEMLRSLNRWISVRDGKIHISGSQIKDPRFQKMKKKLLSLDDLDTDLFIDIISEGVESINGRGFPTSKKELIVLVGDFILRLRNVLKNRKSQINNQVITPGLDV